MQGERLACLVWCQGSVLVAVQFVSMQSNFVIDIPVMPNPDGSYEFGTVDISYDVEGQEHKYRYKAKLTGQDVPILENHRMHLELELIEPPERV